MFRGQLILLIFCLLVLNACHNRILEEATIKDDFYERQVAFNELGSMLRGHADYFRKNEIESIIYCPVDDLYCNDANYYISPEIEAKSKATSKVFEPILKSLNYPGYFFIRVDEMPDGDYRFEIPNIGRAVDGDFQISYRFVFPMSEWSSLDNCADTVFAERHVNCLIPLKNDWAISMLALSKKAIERYGQKIDACLEEINDNVECLNRHSSWDD